MSLFRKPEVIILKDNVKSETEIDKLKLLCENVNGNLRKEIAKQC